MLEKWTGFKNNLPSVSSTDETRCLAFRTRQRITKIVAGVFHFGSPDPNTGITYDKHYRAAHLYLLRIKVATI